MNEHVKHNYVFFRAPHCRRPILVTATKSGQLSDVLAGEFLPVISRDQLTLVYRGSITDRTLGGKMKIQIVGLAALILVSGCAKAPNTIAPSYVSEVPYQSYTCKQLGEEMQRLEAAYTTTAKAQEDARTGDAWGVFLIGMPTSSLSGGNVAAEVASLKGQQVAVQKTMITKNC